VTIDDLISQLVRIRDDAPLRGDTSVVVQLSGSGIALVGVTEACLGFDRVERGQAVLRVPFGNHGIKGGR